MTLRFLRTVLLLTLAAAPLAAAGTELTIATVNNGDMIIMQRLSREFEKRNPDIKLNWVILEENVLRARLTTDIAARGSQFDILTIGTYETPIWGRRGWLLRLDEDLPADYDLNDVLQPIRDGLSDGGRLYALPFYGESSFTFYRKDLFATAGLTMPDRPTWDDIARFARALHRPGQGTYGIVLRGKPGWGENMGPLSTMVHAFGGRWFDEKWRPELDSPEWRQAIGFYVDLVRECGPPGVTSHGHNECRALFATGKAAIWVDATVAASYMFDPSESKVAKTVGFAPAPVQKTPTGCRWLWSWALAVPATSRHAPEAKRFIHWATSKDYIRLVARTEGWSSVPPGTRRSTYEEPAYLKAAPFAGLTLQAILAADPNRPTDRPVPYTGIQYVSIPEFQAIGTQVGQLIAAAVAGDSTVGRALQASQQAVERAMRRAGYLR